MPKQYLSIIKPTWAIPKFKREKIAFSRWKSGGYFTRELVRLFVGIFKAAKLYHPIYQDLLIAELSADGWLTIYPGYWWDGCSGPVIDRKANMRAGLIHDVLYHMMRAGLLDHEFYREPADIIFRDLYICDGGFETLAAADYQALRLFAGYAAKPQPEVETVILYAP